MEKTAPKATPPHIIGREKSKSDKAVFLGAVLDMSWQLAVAVLVPVVGGAWLDKKLSSSHVFLFVGLGLAVVLSTIVVWRAMQAANQIPVPKLTSAQKRAIKKAYEEEDEE